MSHRFVIAIRKKASDQTNKLIAHSCDVENLKSAMSVLQAELEADLALAGEVRHKDEMEKARLEAMITADRYATELDKNWVALKTLHEIQDHKNIDLPLAVAKAEAAANVAR
ncbi:hypothetical protein HAX54_043759 [Datura stramonium]|uniref:Uncharacterized protein n=1 Tax=Datura stramonium TaxID=4076 RepID=A0ABS8SNV2_DATST|nr:hypothetical protein [Datura stramonium]